MRRKQFHNFMLLLFLLVFGNSLLDNHLRQQAIVKRNLQNVQLQASYRRQSYEESCIPYLEEEADRGKWTALYLLETNFGREKGKAAYVHQNKATLEKYWRKNKDWYAFAEDQKKIWNDLRYFPLPGTYAGKRIKVTFEDSWMYERSYGGKRGHEGTDLFPRKIKAGECPVLSITDGVVTNLGWLEKGGFRVGITAPSGAYFYYAHLDSYGNIQKGDTVLAGQILGFIGDSGYGEEGTTGQFPVHLHMGIYLYPNGQEVSINPYWTLRYLQSRMLNYGKEE